MSEKPSAGGSASSKGGVSPTGKDVTRFYEVYFELIVGTKSRPLFIAYSKAIEDDKAYCGSMANSLELSSNFYDALIIYISKLPRNREQRRNKDKQAEIAHAKEQAERFRASVEETHKGVSENFRRFKLSFHELLALVNEEEPKMREVTPDVVKNWKINFRVSAVGWLSIATDIEIGKLFDEVAKLVANKDFKELSALFENITKACADLLANELSKADLEFVDLDQVLLEVRGKYLPFDFDATEHGQAKLKRDMLLNRSLDFREVLNQLSKTMYSPASLLGDKEKKSHIDVAALLGIERN